MICQNCPNITKNPKFCSRNCAASFNNKIFIKRKVNLILCNSCNINYIIPYRNKICKDCRYLIDSSFKQKTIGEYRNRLSVKGKHSSWLNSHIRSFVRSWLKHLTLLPCNKCGYSNHVELAHIRAVTSFPDTTLLSEINNESNIVQLCPNCHWEFDNLPR